MPFPPIDVPHINGHYWSFASIEARANGLPFVGFTGINYSTSLEVGDVYGTKSQKLGTTKGKQNAEGSLELLMPFWEVFRASLFGGVGYGEKRFTLIVQYAEEGMPVKTDILEGCRIVNTEYGNADGTDPSKVTLTLNVMRLYEGVVGRIDVPEGIAF